MSAELAARRTAAEAVLADYHRRTGDSYDVDWRDWQVWALRLGQHLQYLLEASNRSHGHDLPASWVGPDGRATLTGEDLQLVIAALRAAVDESDAADRHEIAALLYRLGDRP